MPQGARPPPKKGAGKKQAPGMPRKPDAKKSLTPYMKFCKVTRPKITSADPSLNFAEIGKALGAAWRKLSAAEKAKFN